MAIGENIKEIRISQGMTQNELAAALNITQSMVAQLERGTKTLTLPLGVQLAQVLHTTLDELIK
ncbi:helix-turn-helix domain-containing protein [Falcatimonas sp. MSJ-15]|uniref:helix-turn-helix domain-containing protein n=1 Tax=Falcatimonas sp. MSJ-15 TaxID=2841515 RepID=UPI001C0FC1AD|nr:helix-turn-helix transcriptional regulator [Falcatimonas sp. MSJ-15]MBU5469160.1 helix-turn-helix domain-containing protein [Falcatimonas sp. MSJ-15]